MSGGHKLSEDWLEVAPFREALRDYLDNGGTITGLSHRIYGDARHTTYIKRMAGLKPFTITRSGERKWYYNRTIHYDNAVALIRGMELDPVDYGL